MKTINVGKLKAQLSSYLRLAGSGEHILVMDRNRPIARISPLEEPAETAWGELARAGLIRPGSQEWGTLRIRPLRRKVPAQRLLDETRGER